MAAPTPRVTVLLPVFNAEPYLHDAVASVLAQGYRDFELIIVDDGSTDASAEIVRRFASADARVQLHRREHRGLVSALNHGIDVARGEYLARADADDLNHPDRLRAQVELLDARPELGACGTWIEVLGSGELWTRPTDPDALAARLLFEVPIFHPTAMVRRDWLERSGHRYDPAYAHAEDYDFWERASAGMRFANLPRPLVRYRLHASQVSHRHGIAQGAASARVRLRILNALGIHPTPAEARLHQRLCAGEVGPEAGALAAARDWLDALAAGNRVAGRFAEPAFSRLLIERWGRVCARSGRSGVGLLAEYVRFDPARRDPRLWRDLVRLVLLRHLPPRALAAAVRVRHRALVWRAPTQRR